MKNSEITSTQGTNQSRKPQLRAQTKKAENIVIEFTSLPDNLKTAEMRKFYDKDASGFLENNNANGQNEIELMQRALGLDLSKYKSNIAKVDAKEHVGMDAKGNKIRAIEKNVEGYDYSTYSNGVKKYEEKLDKNYKPTGEWTKWTHKPNGIVVRTSKELLENDYYNIEEYYNYPVSNGTKEVQNDTLYDKQGQIQSTVERKAFLKKDKDGYEDYYKVFKKSTSYEHATLTKGKNTLISDSKHVYIYQNCYDKSVKDMPNEKYFNVETFTLNGKKVKAKPIGKGRYEVTTEKGNVYYISHDGVNLKPEYVRQKQ